MEGYICDRCGRPLQAAQRSALSIELESPAGDLVGTVEPKDICPDCYGPVRDTIENRIAITKSAPDFIVSVADAPAGDRQEERNDA